MSDRPDPKFRHRDGRFEWLCYTVEFDSPEGSFTTDVWGVSWEHAELQLAALKETGRIVGQRMSEIAGETP